MRSFDAKRLKQGIEAMLIGGAYIEKILDRIPLFEGYDLWRDCLIEAFFSGILINHTAYYYDDPKIKFDVNAASKKIFKRVFGVNESFVRFFFNNGNFFTLQTKKLSEENRRLKIRNNSA